MFRRKPAEELKDALLNPNRTDGDINVKNNQKLKNVFKENPILRQIPPNQRAEVQSI